LLPTLSLGLLLFRIRLPRDAATWTLFAASLLLAIVLSFALRFLINLGAFWMTDIRGLNGIVILFVNFLSGFLVPLAFFPPGLRTIVEALPFAGLISVPVNVFLERAEGGEVALLLARQAFWAAAFVAAALLLFQVATRKVVVQGG
jgi:ABC-2 type transport system permease protein